MSTITISAIFTESNGQPATGLTLSDIDLYLIRQTRSTGAIETVWDGAQNPTKEITDMGIYTRSYTNADLVTYTYYAMAKYTGAETLDTDYVMGSLGGDTDALNNEVPGTYSSGTAGHALGRITAAAITVTSPVAGSGTVSIVRGDDYLAADGRALDWTDSGGTWPTLTDATITLTIKGNLLTKTGSVVTATGDGKKVRVALTNSDTSSLPIGTWDYDVQATLSSGAVVTLVRSTFTVAEDYTT